MEGVGPHTDKTSSTGRVSCREMQGTVVGVCVDIRRARTEGNVLARLWALSTESQIRRDPDMCLLVLVLLPRADQVYIAIRLKDRRMVSRHDRVRQCTCAICTQGKQRSHS
ncbi:hypothetical protein SLA2020_274490 [Shorea laevis]